MNQQDNNFPNWVQNAVFYQIFVDRFYNGDPSNDPQGVCSWGDRPTRTNVFGGDLEGILQRLDYLQDLGINAFYLTPIFRAETNHKYDTSDYYEVDPAFGGMPALKRLTAEIHRRGMRLVLDGVFNHCGDHFWAFQDVVLHGPDSEYAGWFRVRSFPIQRDPLTYHVCGDASYLPQFNHENPAVRSYMLDVGKYWLEEVGIDGWRLDVPFKVPMEFWREFREAVKAVNPEAFLFGEIWREASPWIQGDIFDGATNYRLRELILDYCLHRSLDGEDFAFETRTLRQLHGAGAAGMVNLLGSHDTPRILTLFANDVARLKVALAFLFTTVGVPLIYYGDEVGMQGGGDPDCRRTMIWDEALWDARILRAHRDLITLRHAHPALRYGAVEDLVTFNGVYAYKRSHGEDEVIVILNPRASVKDVIVPINSDVATWQDLFSGEKYTAKKEAITFEQIPACAAMVLLPHPT